MRKTSAYARKRRLAPTYNGAAYLDVIQRSRAYDEDPIIGGWFKGTMDVAQKAMILVRDAYVSIKNGQAKRDDTRAFDILAHALGVTTIRAIDIAGQDEFDNPMMPICCAGNDALERCRQRRLKLGVWGFDGPALEQIDAAVELYETILQSSSPAQMESATVRRMEILREQKLIEEEALA